VEITLFGYVFLVICLLSLFLPKYLFAIVIFSCIFQTASVLNFVVTGKIVGIPPYIVASMFFILKSFPFYSLLVDIWKDKFVQRIIVFATFTVSVTCIYPYLWEGSNVHLTIESNSVLDMIRYGRRSLSFSIGQISQIFYIILLFLSTYSIYRNRGKISRGFIKNIFVLSIIIVILIGFWEFIAKTTEWINFPYDFLYNNSWYAQLYMQGAGGLMRLNSTFTEPSCCGAFLSASFWALLILAGSQYKCLCIFVGIALILNLSGTGMVSFLFGFIVYVSLYFKSGKTYILSFILVGLLLIWIIHEMDYFENIISMLVNKKDSTSGAVRGAATYLTWNVFLQTWGIGVGLGSIRGASFLVSMLASIGVIGVLLLYRVYSYLFRKIDNENQWILIFILVVLVGQCIAIPDINYPIMWMYFFMAAALLPQNLVRNKNVKLRGGGYNNKKI
jgi:hypothetical protein